MKPTGACTGRPFFSDSHALWLGSCWSYSFLKSTQRNKPLIESWAIGLFNYWSILLIWFTHPLINKQWILLPFQINTKEGTHDRDFSYSDEGFRYWQILWYWLTQCLNSEGWVFLPFILSTQAESRDETTALSFKKYMSSMCCSWQQQRSCLLKDFMFPTKQIQGVK